MMVLQPSNAEVVTERAFRTPKSMWLVAAALFRHPESNMQVSRRVPERSPASSSASLVWPCQDAWPQPPTQQTRQGLSPSSAITVRDPNRLSSPCPPHRTVYSPPHCPSPTGQILANTSVRGGDDIPRT